MAWDVVFSKHGYFVFQAEKEAKQSLQLDIQRLKAEKERLQKRIIRLREDPKALEEVIHKELGYVYPDETMIIMPNTNKAETGQEVKKP